MSKWKSLAEKSGQLSTSQDGLFAPIADSYQVRAQSLNAIDAATKASKEIQKNFNMCNRLPKQPIFRKDGTEVEVQDGVMGAMGAVAAELLDLAQTQELSSSLGLGSPGNSNTHEEENNNN